MSMTPEELRARMPPATMRKLRGYQGLVVLFMLLLLVCAAFTVVESATFARAAFSPPLAPTYDVFKRPVLAIFGVGVFASTGVNWCRVRITKLIDDALLRSLENEAGT